MAKGTLVWIDCEMTGLDHTVDRLLEIAVVITKDSLDIVSEKLEIVIHQPKGILDQMNDWCIQHHGESGLTEKVLSSTISEEQAEKKVMNLLKKYCILDPKPLLAGNSVHADLAFLKKYMPSLVELLHYRILDVSTIKELAFRWIPHIAKRKPQKKLAHRAMDDIIESIEELRFYQRMIFLQN